MRSLSKARIKERDVIQLRLQTELFALRHTVAQFNERVAELWLDVKDSLDHYNSVVADAEKWQSDIAEDIQSFIDDRSDAWRDSDKVGQYEEWLAEYEQDIPTIDLEKPAEIEIDEEDAEGIIESISERAISIDG